MTTIPTQSAHPWRATARTILAVVVALLPALPELVDAMGLSAYGWAAGILTVAAGITRVLAIPRVNAALSRQFPWLAAAGREQPR